VRGETRKPRGCSRGTIPRRKSGKRGSPFTLKVDATARDNQSTQDNEQHNRGDYRPPIIFGAPWVGPPTVVARSTSAFKVSIYHRKAKRLGLCRVPRVPDSGDDKGPASAGPEGEPFEEGLFFYANGGIHNPLLTQTWKQHFVPFGFNVC
jgi:hypothetical protein